MSQANSQRDEIDHDDTFPDYSSERTKAAEFLKAFVALGERDAKYGALLQEVWIREPERVFVFVR